MITNKTIILTGASSGLGKELAIQLADHSPNLALVARNKDALEKIRKQITAKNIQVRTYICDITIKDQVDTTIDHIMKDFGHIDILVNNAGIYTTDQLEEHKPETIEQAFKVNAIAPIYLIKAVLPFMKAKNAGHILNIVSKAGTDIPDNKDYMTYAATKWALNGYTKALKYALSDTKIKVSALFPAGFESNIFERAGETEAHNQPWMMQTADVAKAAVFMITQPDDVLIHTIAMENC